MHTEFELIRRYFAEAAGQFTRSEIVLGIGDDAALIDVPDDQLLCVATDVLVADTHFPADAAPGLIAHRALAVNLSDMAAMGASPLCFTLGLTLPRVCESWLADFSAGLLALAKQFDCPLVGGDTTSGPLSIAITVQGLTDRASPIRRDQARPGDLLYVTGCLGDAALALPILGLRSHLRDAVAVDAATVSPEQEKYFTEAFYQPQPRLEFARAAANLVSAGIDISDGLAGELGHIIAASNTGARVEVSKLPFSTHAQQCASSEALLAAALFGGDDYELCLTVNPARQAEFERLAREHGVPVSHVGEITAGDALKLLNRDGSELVLDQSSYQHFR